MKALATRARLARWGRSPALRRGAIAAALVAAACVGLPPALTGAARCLMLEDAPARADIALALAGDPRCLREERAAELYRRGLAGKVVVSGLELAPGNDTADAARRHVIARGVATADVVVLRGARNTRAEAVLLAQVMRERGWHSAILVTSPFHARRALYTMRRAAAGLTFLSAPVPAAPPEWRPERWWTRRGDAWLTIREGLSWINTLAGGLR